jgi:hypothetical protein
VKPLSFDLHNDHEKHALVRRKETASHVADIVEQFAETMSTGKRVRDKDSKAFCVICCVNKKRSVCQH